MNISCHPSLSIPGDVNPRSIFHWTGWCSKLGRFPKWWKPSRDREGGLWDGDLVTEAGSLLCRIMYEGYYKVVNPSIFHGRKKGRERETERGTESINPHTHHTKANVTVPSHR